MEFIDKLGRDIVIEADEDTATAHHNGKQIGFVQTTGRQEDDERLASTPAVVTGWNVDKEYRRAGIATAMVKALVDEIGKSAPGHHNIGIGGTNALTDEGEAITAHCQELGLIYPFREDRGFYDDQ